MENNQSRQQQSSELSASRRARASHREIAQAAGSKSFIELLKHHPWLIWSGVWVFLLAISAIAMLSLTYSGYLPQKEPEPTPVAVEKPAATSSPKGSSMPLWLLSGIALSCAAGSLAIYQRLNRSSRRPRKLRKRVKRSSEQVLPSPTEPRPRFQRRQPVADPPDPSPPAVPVPPETETVVTVLPPEANNQLDSGSESLAEKMDIRKHRSLSSILRDL